VEKGKFFEKSTGEALDEGTVQNAGETPEEPKPQRNRVEKEIYHGGGTKKLTRKWGMGQMNIESHNKLECINRGHSLRNQRGPLREGELGGHCSPLGDLALG